MNEDENTILWKEVIFDLSLISMKFIYCNMPRSFEHCPDKDSSTSFDFPYMSHFQFI
jgi:hypothetical protein